MSTVEEIEAAVRKLPAGEQYRLAKRLQDVLWEAWAVRLRRMPRRDGLTMSSPRSKQTLPRAVRDPSMNSSTSPRFRETYQTLPAPIQAAVSKQYRLWLTNPRHPSLQFKKVGPFLVGAGLAVIVPCRSCSREFTTGFGLGRIPSTISC